MTDDLRTYVDALGRADAATAVAVLEAARARGIQAHALIRHVMVPAQRQVGQLWFDGSWSIADEHAATAVSEQALHLLAPPVTPRRGGSRIVVACAEGEWHALPARLAAELTRSTDAYVVFLGANLPAEQLQRHLRSTSADVLALSCTMATNLLGARRSIDVAHAEGIPVIVGGRAWGAGQHRAQRIGADLRMNDAAAMLAALDELPDSALCRPGPELPAEALLLDAVPQELVLLALERQCAANPWMRQMTPYQRNRSFEDLGWIARHAAAAVGCDDPTVLRELLRWLLDLLTPRGVPAAAVIDSCYFLADVVEPEAPAAAGILRSEADLAHAPMDA